MWVPKPGTDEDAIHDNVAGEIAAVTEKASPVSADLLLIEDSADSNNKKKVQVGNLPSGGGGGDVPEFIAYLNARQSDETAQTEDDFFTDGSLDAKWTTLTVSGAQTITEARDRLSVEITSAQSSADVNAILQSTTLSTGDYIEIRIGALHLEETGSNGFIMAGLCFADGTTAASNCTALMVHRSKAGLTPGHHQWFVSGRGGTFDAMGGVIGPSTELNAPVGSIYLRLEYDASNTFRFFTSGDGITWYDRGTAADTITPTHIGLFWSSWGDAAAGQVVTYDYFRYN